METDQYTIKEYSLKTEDSFHDLYVQEWGNKNGVPIIYIHGGPGSGCSDSDKKYFNPLKQRVIFFDQRGSGRSTPVGSLKENNTQKLVDDIELLRKKAGLDDFVITGGSWGSTLALCYVIKYPEHVSEIVIQGIFIGSKEETDWITKGGFKDFHPDLWDKFVKTVPEEHKNDPGGYHLEKIASNNLEEAKQSAYELGNLEYNLISIDDRPKQNTIKDFDPSGMNIELHYIKNNCFLEKDFILSEASKLTMPIHIVQGRYDMVCRPVIANRLHNSLNNSKIYWTVAGHSSSDRANYDVIKALLSQYE